MREILFRGKTPDGEWVEGFYLFTNENTHPVIIDMECCSHIIIPETVGQFTGKELDGEKLFTGDIIESYEDYDDKFGYPATNVFRSVVIWDNDNFCYAFKTDGHIIQAFNDWDWEYSHKIGNIHDNPEFLKGGAE